MAGKKVSFGTKPQKQPDVDAWVESRESSKNEATEISELVVPSDDKPQARTKDKKSDKLEGQDKMKRLTLDIPETLHRRIKGKAVMEGITMVNMLRELLEKNYG
ncbi:MAG: hypothetical protein WA949_15140 [Phormidesmis sp.]